MGKKALCIGLGLFFLIVLLGAEVLSGTKGERASPGILGKLGIRSFIPRRELQDALKDLFLSRIAKKLNGTLTVGEVTGNLYQHLTLSDVRLVQEGGEVLFIPRLVLRYDMTGIWKRRVTIQQVLLDSPRLSLRQEADGSWNLAHLVKRSPQEKASPRLRERWFAALLPQQVVLQKLRVQEGRIDVTFSRPATDRHRTFQHINLRASGRFSPAHQELRIREFRFTAPTDPPFALVQTEIVLQGDPRQISLSPLLLRTTRSRLEGSLTITRGTDPLVQGRLEIDPLSLSEISALVPGLALQGEARDVLHLSGPLQALHVENRLHLGAGSITLTGQLNLSGILRRKEQRFLPGYDLTLQAQNVDLQAVIPQENLQSDINGEVEVQGQGLRLADLRGTFSLALLPSHLGEIAIGNSVVKGRVQEGLFSLETLDLNAPFATLKGGGKIDLHGKTALTYTLASDLSSLHSLFQGRRLAGRVQSRGEIVGVLDNLQAHGTLQVQELEFDKISLRQGSGSFLAQDLATKPSAQAHLVLEGLQTGRSHWQKVSLEAHYARESNQLSLDLQVQQAPGRTIRVAGKAILHGKEVRVTVPTLRVHFDGRTWDTLEPVRVTLHGSRVEVHSFRWGQEGEFLQLSGTIDPQGKEDFQAQLVDLDLQTVGDLIGKPGHFAGRLQASLTLQGDFQHPEITGQMLLTRGRWATISLSRVSTEIRYTRKRATLHLTVEPQRGDQLRVRGSIPIDLSLKATRNRFLPQPLDIRFVVPRLRLASLLPVHAGSKGVKGLLSLQGRIGGTYWRPQLHGTIALTGGSLGEEWEAVAFRLQFQGEDIRVEGYIPSPVPSDTSRIEVGQFSLTADRLTATQRLSATERVTREVRDLVLHTSLVLSEAVKTIQIKTLRLSTRNPDMRVEEMQAQATLTPTAVTATLSALRIQGAQLEGEGKLSLTAEPRYQATLDLVDVSLPEIGKITGTPLQGKLTGRIRLQGEGKDFQVQGEYRLGKGHLQHTIRWQGAGKVPAYAVRARLQNLHLEEILASLPESDLNLAVDLQGQGLSWTDQNSSLKGTLVLQPSRVMAIQVQRSPFRFVLQRGRLTLFPSVLNTSLFALRSEGKADLAGEVDLRFRLTPRDLATLRSLLKAETLVLAGSLEGKVTGPWKNPKIAGHLQGKEIRYNDITIGNLSLRYGVENLTRQPAVRLRGSLSQLQAAVVSFQKLDLQADLAGELSAPVGRLELVALGGKAEELRVPRIEGVVDYGERELGVQLALLLEPDARLRATGTLPNFIRCRQREMACSPVRIDVTSQNLDLVLLQQLSPLVQQARGGIDLQLRVRGTVEEPDIDGRLQVQNGAITVPRYGIRYRDVRADILLTSQQIRIESIALQGGEGEAKLSGVVRLKGFIPEAFQLRLHADDFTAIQDLEKKLVLKTTLTLTGTPTAPKAQGEISILEAHFPIPPLGQKSLETVNERDLTIQALTGEQAPQEESTAQGEQEEREQRALIKNLEAHLQVSMEKNIWVQSPDGSIELRGALQIDKEPGGEFLLGGKIETVRGFYKFQGRKFVVQRGVVSFPGIPEINPNLDVVATYKIAKYLVTITVGGTARQPSIELSSDPPLEEIDILSLLIFGRPSSELSQSQGASLARQAESLVSGYVAGQLEQVVGQRLGLDTIDISPGAEGFSDSTVSMGRYLTGDIYVSFERQFGEEGGSEARIEYDIGKNLTLEANVSGKGNSGVDLFWSFDY